MTADFAIPAALFPDVPSPDTHVGAHRVGYQMSTVAAELPVEVDYEGLPNASRALRLSSPKPVPRGS
jgi:hypothetical protein